MGSDNGDGHSPAQCRVREVLDLVADKWSLYTVSYLGDGPRRFTELKRGIDGISQGCSPSPFVASNATGF